MTPERLKELLSKEEKLDLIDEYEKTDDNNKVTKYAVIANHELQEVFEIDYEQFRANEDTEHQWNQIKGVLGMKRPAQTIRHLSRIVGYFSYVENWNNSKVGELKDRQEGNYSITQKY